MEPILSTTTLATCPVSVKDFHRKFIVESKKNCPTDPEQLDSEQRELRAKVNRLQYTVDVLTRYLLLPVAHMVAEPTSFPEAHHVWPKIFSAETGPLSFQIEDLADKDTSTREYAELELFQTKFCARCLRPGSHVASECFASKDINNNDLKKKNYSGYGMMSDAAERFGSEVPHSMAHRMDQENRVPMQYRSRYECGYQPMEPGMRADGYSGYEDMDRSRQYVGQDGASGMYNHMHSFAGRGGLGHRSGMAGPERGYGPGRGAGMPHGRGQNYHQAGRGGGYGRQGR